MMSDQILTRRNDSLNASALRRNDLLSELITNANAHTNYLTKLLKSYREIASPPNEAAYYTQGIHGIKHC